MGFWNELFDGFSRGRGAGHTQALVDAAILSRGILIVAEASQCVDLRKKHPSLTVVSIDSVHCGSLRGMSGPIILDHFALETLIDDANRKMDEADCAVIKAQRLTRDALDALN